MFISALISRCSCGKSPGAAWDYHVLQGLSLLEQRLIPMGVNNIQSQEYWIHGKGTLYSSISRDSEGNDDRRPWVFASWSDTGRKQFHLPTVHLNLKQSGSCGQGLSSTHWLGVHHACHQGPEPRWVKVLLKERYLVADTLLRSFKLKITLNSWKRKKWLVQLLLQAKDFKITAYALKYMLWDVNERRMPNTGRASVQLL